MKTRRQGNAIVLTIPAKFGIPENVEYVAIKGADDSIAFIRKMPNIFAEAYENGETIDAGLEFPDEEPIGREII